MAGPRNFEAPVIGLRLQMETYKRLGKGAAAVARSRPGQHG